MQGRSETVFCCANTTRNDRSQLLNSWRIKTTTSYDDWYAKVADAEDKKNQERCYLQLAMHLVGLVANSCVFPTECIITCSANGSQAVIQISWNKLLLGYNEECGNQCTSCDDVIEIFEKFKLSREEVGQWLANDDISLFEPLSDDEVFETMEKDENEDT
ncbi:hypothetical protein T07_9540 [Trichinella nelsoni]|uniref:Uncharacterized protein n=1 Tax=Trichinella nelsoni TaxID=6336 RepID=A0A0V0RGV4_9BILA|nr:hypothetical protein T07_9540 [Trichinella nelsoni]